MLTGLGIDEYFSRTDVPAATMSHLLPDALGSAFALTDAAGAIQTEYTYEPFGRTTLTGASNSNPFQYTGRENDGTGLYYYRARYYHPILQRFLSEDPIEFYGGDFNLYAYVYNDPLGFIDPMGLDKKEPAPLIRGGEVVPGPTGPRPRPWWMLPPYPNRPADVIPLRPPPRPTPPVTPPGPELFPLINPNVDLFRNYLDSLTGRASPDT